MKRKTAAWSADAFEAIFKHFNEFPTHIITDRGLGFHSNYLLTKLQNISIFKLVLNVIMFILRILQFGSEKNIY